MPVVSLSPEARHFIDHYLRTVEDLDVLLLLRTDSVREWEPSEVSRQLGIALHSASNHLMALHLSGLVEHRKNRYRYQPRPKVKEERVTELAGVLSRSRGEIFEYLRKSQREQLENALRTSTG